MRRFGRSLEDSTADLADLKMLSLKSISTADLMEEAVILAKDLNLTAHDACYAVLARRLEIPLVTADEPMAKAVDWAVGLGDFEV
jgi:predicted nucleic acid-binding protein